MNPLVVLPTLDGTREAAIARLDAWASAPARQRMFGASWPRSATLGDVTDREALLDLHLVGGVR